MLTARLLTLRFDALLERFDEAPLMQLQRNVPAESIHQHFFLHQETPYLLLVLMCRSDHAEPAGPGAASKAATEPFAWKQLLSEADQPLFQSLRRWRGQRAQSEGLSPYRQAAFSKSARRARAFLCLSFGLLTTMSGFGAESRLNGIDTR
ncbi:MAG: hypothetical protein Q8M37_11580 [Nevskia sp.]|nr:hypothetical protein [Nevskia sp.]